MMNSHELEQLAGLILEDNGISLPLQTVLRKKPFRITMFTPTLQSQIRMGRIYNRIGVSPQELDSYNLEQRIRFVYLHGKDVSRMVAYGIIRGYFLGKMLNRPMAWLLRSYMTDDQLCAAWRRIMDSMSTRSFDYIIASAAAMDRMQPMTSRKESENDRRS